MKSSRCARASSHLSWNLAGRFAFSAAMGGQQGAPIMLQLHLEDIRHAEIALLAGRFRKRPVSVTFVNRREASFSL